ERGEGESRGDWRPMLLAKPIPNARVEIERWDDGSRRLTVPRRRPWYWVPPLSWMQPFCDQQTIVLDRLSGRIWDLCDGERTVERIVEIFAAEERLTFHEARVAVTQVIEGLVRRGGLAIAMPRLAPLAEEAQPKVKMAIP
ncbi:MAG: PqqD family protein, partial [Planctomycetota bacterium]|nr:PqqD family protein [Planctomycetota bacterium]